MRIADSGFVQLKVPKLSI